jgi:hypothetical protein
MSTRFAHFDGERGHLTVIDDNDFVTRLVTVKATPGRVVVGSCRSMTGSI